MQKKILASGLCVVLFLVCAVAAFFWKNVALMLLSATLASLVVTILWRRGRDLCLVLSSLMLALTATELILWAVMPSSGIHFDPSSGFVNNYWQASDLGAQPRPGKHSSRLLGPDDEEIYDVTYTIGADGFRVTPDVQTQREGRVNFFGGSFTFGDGLEDRDTLPYHFGQLRPEVAVKNFGISGFGVHHALAILQSERDTAGDTHFLLTAPWHAERSACIPDYASGSPRYQLDANGHLVRNGFCGGNAITKRSAIVAYLKRILNYGGTQDQQIRLYLSLLREIAAVSSQRGQRLVVGFIKADDAYFHGEWSNQRIITALADSGMTVLDMTLAPRNEDLPSSYYLHILDKHPSGLANMGRAAILSDYLQLSGK